MTDCREVRDLLQDEMDGRLSGADAERLALHLASCAECALEKQALASLRAKFRATPNEAAPAGFKDGVMSALPKGRVRSMRPLAWIAPLAAAASVLLVIALRDRTPAVEGETARAKSVVAERRDAEESDVPHAAAPRPSTKAERGEEARETATADEAAPAPTPPAAPPVVQPPKPTVADAAEKKADAAALGKTASPPRVRYVVFRDAAAAERFARGLAAPAAAAKPPDRAKDEKADEGAAAREAGYVAAPPTEQDAAKESLAVLKEASAASPRVVARTAMTAPPTDAALAADAAAAGGTVVPDVDAAAFLALLEKPTLDAPAPGAAAPSDDDKPTGKAKRRARKEAAGGGGAAAADGESGPFVVVVVVLEPPPPPASPPAPTSPR